MHGHYLGVKVEYNNAYLIEHDKQIKVSINLSMMYLKIILTILTVI